MVSSLFFILFIIFGIDLRTRIMPVGCVASAHLVSSVSAASATTVLTVPTGEIRRTWIGTLMLIVSTQLVTSATVSTVSRIPTEHSPSTPLGSNTVFFIGSNGRSTISGQDVDYSYGHIIAEHGLVWRCVYSLPLW